MMKDIAVCLAVMLGLASLLAWPRLVALLLWRCLRSRGAHFVQPVCLLVTAVLASLFVLSLEVGCGLALALSFFRRLPFGKRKAPWQTWLQCSGVQEELVDQAKAACPGTTRNGLGLTAEQRSFLEAQAKQRFAAL